MNDLRFARSERSFRFALCPRLQVLLLLFGLACTSAEEEVLSTPRVERVLTEDWRFLRSDAAGAEEVAFDEAALSFESVRLPHTYNALDGQDGGSDYYRGVAWYRTRLSPGRARDGRRIYLQFDAASGVADVYVNGSWLGQHRGSFAAFRFDATDALSDGDNVLAVKVDNSPSEDVAPLSGDFTNFGGLYRDVRVLDVAALHVDLDDFGSSGVYLKPSEVTPASATLGYRVRLTNALDTAQAATVTVSVRDARGSEVARFATDTLVGAGETTDVSSSGSIESPHLWDGRSDPYVYTAQVQVQSGGRLVDRVTQPLGFRSFSVDPELGFSLNGRSVDLHGVNRHQDRQGLGWAIGKAQHDEDMALISELGATAVRLAHYQHADYFYELCDAAGLAVWAEIPLIDEIGASAEFAANARQQLTELIRQNYNHPSILFWGIGNEQRSDDEPTNALLGELSALVQIEDSSRLSTYAHCCISATAAITSHADLTGFNVYYGWYMGALAQFGPFMDTVHGLRPNDPLAVSEYGAGAGLSQHEEPPMAPAPAGPFHPEEYQSAVHEAHWPQIAARPYLWGKFVWNMFDFAVDSRAEGDTPGRNDKGLVSYDRQVKKDAFFFYKANWSSEPFVHITSRRFEPRSTPSIDVKVYTNQGVVRLRVNGVDQGDVAAQGGIVRWPGLALEVGPNQVEASALGDAGELLYTDSVVWTRR